MEKSLQAALNALKVEGVLVVITFHSLEDRIVKQLFKKVSTLNLPKGIPFVPDGYEVKYELINSKIILPSDEELKENNRSHSAKLRAIKRIKTTRNRSKIAQVASSRIVGSENRNDQS